MKITAKVELEIVSNVFQVLISLFYENKIVGKLRTWYHCFQQVADVHLNIPMHLCGELVAVNIVLKMDLVPTSKMFMKMGWDG